ncbi:MAG: peroxidase [Burkholderiaceae bacterium]|nr:peroxidase [Burkholderiaceae bacterium]
MTQPLDLTDIQADVIRASAHGGYLFARYVFFNIRDGEKGRAFVAAVAAEVTNAVIWEQGAATPPTVINIAFSYQGLKELGLPRASLNGFPDEFVMGMKARRAILGDNGPSHPDNWDPIWQANRVTRDKDVHIQVSINGKTPQDVEVRTQWLLALAGKPESGVFLLTGHRGPNGQQNLLYQDVHALFENGVPTPKEHFGYTDGISDPVFEGQPGEPWSAQGRGKQMADGSWAPLATGEFLLGHVDEAHEYPPAPQPQLLARNGTFMVYRKLHENVHAFDTLLEREAQTYPGGKELLAAKFVGRWRDNGAPLVSAPDAAAKAEWDQRFATATPQEQDRMLNGFTYDQDMSGSRCPFAAHMRRINPRASLQLKAGALPGQFVGNPGAFDTPGALANRRRIARRGLPYGDSTDRSSDRGNHGIVIMMLNADINRQFEFVQQQWINYGNDFRAANDKEILLGNHDKEFPSKAVLPVDPESEDVPYFVRNIPRLVETRGGEYFFIPSLTALRLIARGLVDPT